MKKIISALCLSVFIVNSAAGATITAELEGDTITYNGETYIKITSNELPKVKDVDWQITKPEEKLKKEFNLVYSLKDANRYYMLPEDQRDRKSEAYKAYDYYKNKLKIGEDYIESGNIMYIEWSETADITRHIGDGITVMQDGKSLPMFYKKSAYSSELTVLKGSVLKRKNYIFYNRRGGKIQLYNAYTNELLKELSPVQFD